MESIKFSKDGIVLIKNEYESGTIDVHAIGNTEEIRDISATQEQKFLFDETRQDWFPIGEPWDKPPYVDPIEKIKQDAIDAYTLELVKEGIL